jgi:hypothetical protein
LPDSKIPKKKTTFEVELRVEVPAIMIYRVFCETPEEAAEEVERIRRTTAPNSVRYELPKHRSSRMTVKEAGSSLIRFVKAMWN